jgi:hypothetical protein
MLKSYQERAVMRSRKKKKENHHVIIVMFCRKYINKEVEYHLSILISKIKYSYNYKKKREKKKDFIYIYLCHYKDRPDRFI